MSEAKSDSSHRRSCCACDSADHMMQCGNGRRNQDGDVCPIVSCTKRSCDMGFVCPRCSEWMCNDCCYDMDAAIPQEMGLEFDADDIKITFWGTAATDAAPSTLMYVALTASKRERATGGDKFVVRRSDNPIVELEDEVIVSMHLGVYNHTLSRVDRDSPGRVPDDAPDQITENFGCPYCFPFVTKLHTESNITDLFRTLRKYFRKLDRRRFWQRR